MAQARKIFSALALYSMMLSCGYSQIESYNLSNYVQGNVNLTNAYISPWFQFSTYSLDQDSRSRTFDRGALQVFYNYSKFINAENRYFEYDLNNTLWINTDQSNEEKSLQISPQIDYDFRGNFYFFGKQFVGIDFDTRNYIILSKDFGAINNDPSNGKDYFTNSQIEISYGFGRAQNIEDPLKAIAIFRILKQNKFLLVDSVSHQDVDDLSNLLNRLRSLRNEDISHVDSRLLRNAQFELLAEHLIKKELVRADNFVMLSLLYDTYRFENYYFWKTNNEFRVGLSNYYDYNVSTSQPVFYENKRINWMPGVFMSYEVNKPLSTKWFFNGDTRIDLNRADYQIKSTTEEETYSEKEIRKNASLSTEWEIQYQPNIRTRFNAGLLMFLSKSNIKNDLTPEVEEDIHNVVFNVGLDYYFSPQYLMSLDLGISERDQRSTEYFRKEISTSLRLNVYYIFR